MIRILLAEDMNMVRGALVALLDLEDDLEVVSELSRGDEILAAALDVRPDIAIIDIDLPGLDGLSAAMQIHEHLPECRTLMLTSLGRPGTLRRARANGTSRATLCDQGWLTSNPSTAPPCMTRTTTPARVGRASHVSDASGVREGSWVGSDVALTLCLLYISQTPRA